MQLFALLIPSSPLLFALNYQVNPTADLREQLRPEKSALVVDETANGFFSEKNATSSLYAADSLSNIISGMRANA